MTLKDFINEAVSRSEIGIEYGLGKIQDKIKTYYFKENIIHENNVLEYVSSRSHKVGLGKDMKFDDFLDMLETMLNSYKVVEMSDGWNTDTIKTIYVDLRDKNYKFIHFVIDNTKYTCLFDNKGVLSSIGKRSVYKTYSNKLVSDNDYEAFNHLDDGIDEINAEVI